MIRFFLIAVLVAITIAIEEYISPTRGMQGLSIKCDNEEKLNFVLQYEGHKDFNFVKITQIPNVNIELLVTADQVFKFKKQLESHGIEYVINIEDVQKIVDEESRLQKIVQTNEPRSLVSDVVYSFDYYPRYEQINQILKQLSELHEDITLLKIGSSYENRIIYGVKISSNETNSNKPAILIDAGNHAREWIAPVTALFAIFELVKESNKNLYENIDWYIIPLLNPDGYEFTHTKDRYWRKTRSNTSIPECFGVDINRNFDFKWMKSESSSDPCKIQYEGDRPFSEVESRNLRDFILSKNGSIKIYSSLHSFGEYLLFPWGYTKELTTNYKFHNLVAAEAVEAISTLRGTKYHFGSVSHVLYEAAGGSLDWVFGVGGANLSYVLELPGIFFHVPPQDIISIGLETFEAFKVFAKYIHQI